MGIRAQICDGQPQSILPREQHFIRQGRFDAIATFVLILSLVVLSSCVGLTSGSKGQPGTPSGGVLSPSSDKISFGNVSIGSTASKSLTVTNTGTATVNISQSSITGTGITILGGNPTTSIAPGQSVKMQIQFAPHSEGISAGNLTLVSDASNSSLTVPVDGIGIQSELTMTPPSFSFGNVTVGQSSSLIAKITNSGSQNLALSDANISGNGFSITGLSLPATISVNQSLSFTIQFHPTVAGGVAGSITLTDNAAASPQAFPVTGTGVSPNSTLNSSPGSFAFGNVVVGTKSNQTFSLTNTGTTGITISQATVAGTGFSMTGLSVPIALGPSQSTSFTASFSPTVTGNASGTITINSTASNPSLTIGLSGTGTQGQLTATPTSISFGTRPVNSSGSALVTLINSGTASLTITADSASGTGFSIGGLSVPSTLTPGQGVQATVTFTPPSVGNFNGNVSIFDNLPTSSLMITLTGSGASGQLAATPPSASFGNVATGTINTQTINLSNTGAASVTITQANASGSGFSANGLFLPLTIAAGKSSSFNLAFSPTTAGAVNGSITLVSNASISPFAIPASGTGVAASGILGANPTSLGFGNVDDGSNSTLSVSLTNSGNSNVTISGVSATGTGFSASGVSSGMTIGPSQTATLHVVFAPINSGAVNGSVSVVSNATNSPATVVLSGTGVQASSHAVSLNWTASTSSSVTGYNVYRGTAPGSYSRISSSQVSGTNYTDSTVQSGQSITYYYVVTAVNSSSEESTDSNMASALVP